MWLATFNEIFPLRVSLTFFIGFTDTKKTNKRLYMMIYLGWCYRLVMLKNEKKYFINCLGMVIKKDISNLSPTLGFDAQKTFAAGLHLPSNTANNCSSSHLTTDWTFSDSHHTALLQFKPCISQPSGLVAHSKATHQ